MSSHDLRAAWDATLPSSAVHRRVLENILAAAAAPEREEPPMKRTFFTRSAALALAAALALGVTALAAWHLTAHGVTALEAPGRTAQEVTLYDLPPLPFDRAAYAAYAESPANDGSAIPREYTYGGERVFFPDEAAFTKTTGVPIPHEEDLSLAVFSVMDQEPLVHQISFDATATLDGRSCRLMGAFATEGIFGYHYGQEMPVYDSFEYAPGHRAYLLEYHNEETDVRLYWFLFAENGIFYRIPLTDGTQVYDPALTPESADMDFYRAVMASLAAE